MAILSDFVFVVDDSPVSIGDSNRVWQAQFRTGGRVSSQPGFLIFNVRGLTHSSIDVGVSINGTQVGTIGTYRPGGAGINTSDINQPDKWRHAGHWYTQMIAFGGRRIKKTGDNNIQIEAVQFPENTEGNRFDDFQIKNMICFFHQRD